jgi:hypothetical protein
VICERPGCGTVFCWDGADEVWLGKGPKRFCSKECQRYRDRGADWRSRQLAACERSPKRGQFDDEMTAKLAALRIRLRSGDELRAYECACGRWHLTSNLEWQPSLRDSLTEVRQRD